MYKLNKDLATGMIRSVNKENPDGSGISIPFHPDNTDYQAYLVWISEGNVPEPAEQ